MFLLSLVLPVLAICFAAYLIYYPLPVLFGIAKYSQKTDSIPEQVQAIANEREQDDEYETLVTLGFKPLGTHDEIYGFLSTEQPILIFVHEQLPIVAHLIVNIDKQLYLKMTTTGHGDCILDTSSSPNGIEVDDSTFRASRHKVSKTEDIFSLHMKAMSQWELEGFKPILATSLADVEHQNLIIMAKEPVKKIVRNACVAVALGSIAMTVLFPILFGSFTGAVSLSMLKIAPFTPVWFLIFKNFIAVWSLGCSFFWYSTVVNLKSNPKRNSIGNRSKILTTKRVDIKKVVDGNETRFELPYRNDPDQRVHALPFAIGSIVAIPFFTLIPAFVGVFWVMQVSILAAVPISLWAIFAFRIITGMFGSAWRILLGKSIQDLSIKDGELHSRERCFIIHSHQQCPVDEIVAIHILPIKTLPHMSPYFGDDIKSDWGVLAIERSAAEDDSQPAKFQDSLQLKIGSFFGRQNRPKGYPLHVAACYPLDTLTSLAHELAFEIGLSAGQVFVSDDILNPKTDQEEAGAKSGSTETRESNRAVVN